MNKPIEDAVALLELKPLMEEVCVNVRCIICDRSLIGVNCTDRRCAEEGLKCGLRTLLRAYVSKKLNKEPV